MSSQKDEGNKPTHRCLSIITQFGCHYKCPYCIVMTQDMNFKFTDETIFPRLIEKLKSGVYDSISLSGGGDPLYNFERNVGWYDKLYEIMSSMFPQIKIKLHTSYLSLPPKLVNHPIFSLIYLIAYHVNFNNKLYPSSFFTQNTTTSTSTYDINSCKMELIRSYPHIQNRVVFVVEDYFTPQLIDTIYQYTSTTSNNHNIHQLTFRQLIDKDYNTTSTSMEYLLEGHKKHKWFYVHGTDFNEYLTMTSFETKFRNFKDIEEV